MHTYTLVISTPYDDFILQMKWQFPGTWKDLSFISLKILQRRKTLWGTTTLSFEMYVKWLELYSVGAQQGRLFATAGSCCRCWLRMWVFHREVVGSKGAFCGQMFQMEVASLTNQLWRPHGIHMSPPTLTTSLYAQLSGGLWHPMAIQCCQWDSHACVTGSSVSQQWDIKIKALS